MIFYRKATKLLYGSADRTCTSNPWGHFGLGHGNWCECDGCRPENKKKIIIKNKQKNNFPYNAVRIPKIGAQLLLNGVYQICDHIGWAGIVCVLLQGIQCATFFGGGVILVLVAVVDHLQRSGVDHNGFVDKGLKNLKIYMNKI